MTAQPSGEESSGTPLRPADRGAAGLRLDQPSDRGHGVRTRQPPRRYDAGMTGPSGGGRCDLARDCHAATVVNWPRPVVVFAVPDVTPPFHPLMGRVARAVRQAPAPGTGASFQSGPDDPSFAACRPGPFTDGVGAGFSSPWTVPADARGCHRTPSRRFSRRGLPGDGRTCFPPSCAQELGNPTSLRLRRPAAIVRHGNGAHAPPSLWNLQTGIPICLALSARLS